MKVTDLDGREVTWSLRGYEVKANDKTPRSKPHLRAREIIKRLFPTDLLYEEVFLPNSQMRLDFYVPGRDLAVEVQGKQHDEYTPHFHGPPANYINALKRDRKKKEFCEMNGIDLIYLMDGESDEVWREAFDGH